MNKQIKTLFILISAFLITGCTNKSTAPEESVNLNQKQIPPASNKISNQLNNQGETMPKMQIDKNKTYQAVLSTSAGDITINLYADKTPITVNNFISLSKKDFYNQTIFHRTIKGFMIQGGDPKGDGTGDPGYKFNDEPFTGEYTRGIVAMANSGPNTNGSQFFIMHQDYDLPQNYVIFGKVTKGIEVVDKIVQAPVITNTPGENSTPVNPASIKSIKITEK